MKFLWLKRYLPRGLYGRAALILLVPIIAIQLIVSAAFIQRYFADVTRQMTSNLSVDLAFLLSEIDSAPDLQTAQARMAELAPPLMVEVALPADARVEPFRAFYDLSGISVESTLRARLAGVEGVNLGPDQQVVRFDIATRYGPARISFSRTRVSASNPHQLLVIMIFAGILLTVISYIFLRNQLRPIKRLASAAEAFGRGRSTDYHPGGALEVRAAGSAFLDMRQRIERQMEQRTLLLSGVSHDLRTPLTRLKLGLSLLGDDAETRDLRRDVTEMEALIDAFLEFARGDATEEPVPTDALGLVKTIVQDAVRSGKAVKLGRLEGQGEVPMRPVAIRRAVENLLGNAVRYGKTAQVSVVLSDRALRISVEDDGPGIPKDLRERAVQPFQRLDPGRNQNKGSGVGLGLAIAFDIARNHGGSLRLGDSGTLGGLKVEIILPR